MRAFKRATCLGSVTVGLMAFATGSLVGQDAPFDVRDHYLKSEYMVPMRDGVRLFTIVYTPKDASTQYPILFLRTPYSIRPYGPDAYAQIAGPRMAPVVNERY